MWPGVWSTVESIGSEVVLGEGVMLMNRVTGRVGVELGEGVMLMNRVTGRVGVELGEGVMLMNRVTGRVGVELSEGVMLINRVTGRVGVELGERLLFNEWRHWMESVLSYFLSSYAVSYLLFPFTCSTLFSFVLNFE